MRKTDRVARQELYDTQDEQRVPGRLGYFLRLCHQDLWPLFQKFDQEALDAQAIHRRLSWLIATFGTFALLLGCLQLALLAGGDQRSGREPAKLAQALQRTPATPPAPEGSASKSASPDARSVLQRRLTYLEGILVGLTGAGVLVGLALKRHRAWLLRRYQAERLRLLKFRDFGDPRIWSGQTPVDDWESDFRREIDQVRELEAEELDSIAHREPIPDHPQPAVADSVPEMARRELLTYYRIKRLEPQIEYFERKANRVLFLENPVLLPLVFFASLVLVLAHAAFEMAGHPGVALTLAFFSLALPVFWAGIRTYRTANEFARNRSRSLAKEHALREIAVRLARSRDGASFFADIVLAEYILASDQHEWLRLMLEAEWYG